MDAKLPRIPTDSSQDLPVQSIDSPSVSTVAKVSLTHFFSLSAAV